MIKVFSGGGTLSRIILISLISLDNHNVPFTLDDREWLISSVALGRHRARLFLMMQERPRPTQPHRHAHQRTGRIIDRQDIA